MKLMLLILVLILASCKRTVEVTEERQSPGTIIDSSDSSEDNPVEGEDELVESPPKFRCAYTKLSDELRSPTSIKETIDLINALPKPLEMSCFLQSLRRPLKISLTDSRLSAQPAEDRTSPRVFLFQEDFIMSITLSGKASSLLEFGEKVQSQKALRGELEFPIYENLDHDAAFRSIYRETTGTTTCSACHQGEEEHGEAFKSQILRPKRKTELSDLEYETYLCQLNEDNQGRCRLIRAVMAFGEVQEVEFPEFYPTMF